MVRRFPSLPCNKRPESSCSCCCEPAEAQLTFFRFSLWFHATPKRTDALGSARAISTNHSAIFFFLFFFSSPPPTDDSLGLSEIEVTQNSLCVSGTLCEAIAWALWHCYCMLAGAGSSCALYGYRHSRCWRATLCPWDRKPSDKIIRLSFQITDSTSLAALEDVKPLGFFFFFTTHHVFHIMQRAKE